GTLVMAQAQERRMSEEAVRRPLAKAHFADVDGIDPRGRANVGDVRVPFWRAPGHHYRAEAGRVRPDGCRQQGVDLTQLRIREPGPGATGVDERAVDVVRELQCTQAAPAASGLREADDHEIPALLG